VVAVSDISLGTASAEIIVNSSGAQQGTQQAQQAFNQLNDVVRNNWWGLRNVGLAMADVAAAAEGSLAVAVDEAVKWEDSMARVETQFYDTTKSADENAAAIGRVSDQLKDLASNAGNTTPAKLAQIAEGAARLGVQSTDIARFTETINDLGQTTDASATVSTEALGRLTAELGLNQQAIGRTGDVIFDLSRKTPATATNIEQLAQRLAGSASAAGFTTPQILGLSSAIATVAPNSRTGASAVIAMFDAITNAVRDGGTSLDTFAKLTGQTAQQFADQWRTDAAGALTAVVDGLGKANASGADMAGVMDNLNLKSGSQQTILLALAAAQEQNVDVNAKLSSQLQISNQAWEQGNSLQNAAQRQFQTTEAQLAELRNTVTIASISFGELFLPVIKFVVDVLKDFATGVAYLPTPLRAAIAIITAAIGAVAAFGAAIFLVGPRVILMRDALSRLTQAMAQNTGAAAENAVAQEATATSAGVATIALEEEAVAAKEAAVAMEQLALFNEEGAISQEAAAAGAGAHATQLQLFATSARGAGEAGAAAGEGLGAAGAAAEEAAPAVAEAGAAAGEGAGLFSVLGDSVSGILGPIGLAIGAIGLIGTIITALGHAHRQAAQDTKDHAQADMGLIGVIDREGTAAGQGAKGWIIQQLTMAGVITTAENLKISLSDLIAIVQGVSSPSTTQGFTNAVTAAAKGGDQDAKKLGTTIKGLHDIFRASADAAAAQARAEQAAGVAAEGTAGDMSHLGDAVDEATKKQSKANQALIDYTSALLNQQEAALNTQEAEKRLADAQAKAADVATQTAKASLALEQARLQEKQANEELSAAEEAVATARADAAQKVEDATLAVGDAQDKLADSDQKVKDATLALNDAQKGATERELRDAINAVANARIKLTESTRHASDAQWYLNYLQSEGASARDIQNAQDELAKANQQVADSTVDLSDKTEDLNKKQAGADPEKVAKAQRELGAAIRDQERATEDLATKQKDLLQAQRDLASDKAYTDAMQKQEDAQLRVQEAAFRVADAQKALTDQQKNNALDVQRAQLDVEQALYRQAQANVEVQKQAALAKGEEWNAGKEALAMSDQLTKMGLNAAGPVRDNLLKMADALRGAKDVPDETPGAKSGTGGVGGGRPVGGPALGPDTAEPGLAGLDEKVKKHTDIWGKIIKSGMGLIGGFLGASVGADIGAGIGSFGGPIGTIIGGLAGFAIGELVGKLLTPLIKEIVKWAPGAAKALWHFIEELPGNIGRWTGQALTAIGHFFTSIPGTVSKLAKAAEHAVVDWIEHLPETAAHNFGLLVGYTARAMVDIAKAIAGGVKDFIRTNVEGWKQIGEDVIHGVEKLPGLVTEAWHNMYMAVKHGIEDIISGVHDFVVNLPENLEALKESLARKAHEAWQRFTDAAGQEIANLISWAQNLPGRIRDAIGDLATALFNKARSAWHSFVSGVTEAYPDLGNWLAGLPQRLKDSIGDALSILKNVGGDIIRGLWNGITGMSDWFKTNIVNWIEDHIPGPMKAVMKALSPSKRTAEIGKWVVEGLAQGMEDHLHLLEQASINAANATVSNLDTIDLSKYTAEPHKALVGAGVGARAEAGQVVYDQSQTTHEGDKWEVNAANMDPIDLMREASWRKRTRRR
jgi:TP901 family phage tail tape measure protein